MHVKSEGGGGWMNEYVTLFRCGVFIVNTIPKVVIICVVLFFIC